MAEPLRVILNDRALTRTRTGVGHYIEQLLLHLPAVQPPVRVDPFLFTYPWRRDWRSKEAEPAGAVEAAVVAAGPAAGERTESAEGGFESETRTSGEENRSGTTSAPAARDISASRKPWWFRRLLQGAHGVAFRALGGRYGLYHEPNHVPIRCELPTVTTIHDLSVLAHPEWHPADRVRWYEREFAAGVRQTRRFIAASEFTKREMAARLNLSPENIDVTYQAPRPAFRPQTNEQVRAARAALQLPESFFLYVGTLEPRKNVVGLLEAYARLPADLRERVPLVLAGAWGWNQEELRAALRRRGISTQVRLTGYLRDALLAGLYSACAALVWPTFYEGFGLPPLEALACGAAVITSNVASLPEVVGEAGVLLDPSEPAAWAEAMRRAAEDGVWRAEWGRRGLAQAARFSWARCAAQTAACYRAALEE